MRKNRMGYEPGKLSSPIWSCTGWGLPGSSVATAPVRSYRTISPLPVRLYQEIVKRGQTPFWNNFSGGV